MLPLTLWLLACAPHPVAPSAAVARSASVPEPGPASPIAEPTLSPPVTLDQFRAAFPVGTHLRLSIAVPGQPTVEQRWTWTAADAEGCTIAATVHDADGTLLNDEGAAPTTWAELMTHAVFPASRTTREDASVDVPAGHFDTWLFTVRSTAKNGTPKVERHHFAREMPGPPVLYTVEEGGTEVFRMTLLERRSP